MQLVISMCHFFIYMFFSHLKALESQQRFGITGIKQCIVSISGFWMMKLLSELVVQQELWNVDEVLIIKLVVRIINTAVVSK